MAAAPPTGASAIVGPPPFAGPSPRHEEPPALDDPCTTSVLLRLQNWLSPAFPIGAYTCSHGLEAAISDGTVDDAGALDEWLRGVLEHGSGWNDAVVLRASHAALDAGGTARLQEIAELSLALSAGAERRHESAMLGASFRRAATPWLARTRPGSDRTQPDDRRADDPATDVPVGATIRDPLAGIDGDCPLPVAIGALAARCALPSVPVLAAASQATVSNLAWIATRLVPLGQSATLGLLAGLEPTILALARRAERTTLDDLGGCAVLADIASLRHERLASRVCRT